MSIIEFITTNIAHTPLNIPVQLKNKIKQKKNDKTIRTAAVVVRRNESLRKMERKMHETELRGQELVKERLRAEKRYLYQLSVLSFFFWKIKRILWRAIQRQKSYQQVTQEKVQVEIQLKQKAISLAKTKKKLEAFQQRDESLREMRRQLNEALTQVKECSTNNLRAEER